MAARAFLPVAFFGQERLAPKLARRDSSKRRGTPPRATLTTGLAASMQILGPFGPLFAFRIGQPGISLGLFEGALTIACAAAMQAAIVPITGKLLDYPGLILAFLFVVFAAIAYLLVEYPALSAAGAGRRRNDHHRLRRHFRAGPDRLGIDLHLRRNSGGDAGDGRLRYVDLALFAGATITRVYRGGLRRARAGASTGGPALSRSIFGVLYPLRWLNRRLTPNLVLLKSVEEHMKPTPQRLAALLDAVMTAEHVYLEVERLAVLADEPVADEVRQDHRRRN